MDLFDSGINVTAAKERFMNNEEIFKRYLFQFRLISFATASLVNFFSLDIVTLP